MSDSIRVLVAVQPSVSHYRAPFVRALLDQAEIDVELVGRINRTNTGNGDPVAASEDVVARVGELHRRTLLRAVHWDRGLIPKVLRTTAEVVVLEGNVYGVSNWVAIGLARLRRRNVILWGHAWKRPEQGVKLAVRRFFYGLADGHLTYGEWAPNFARAVGLNRKFLPVYNSIYPERIVQQSQARTNAPSAGDSLNLIYSGRLTARHNVAQAILAVLALNSTGHDAKLVVVGDGPERQRLDELASESDQIEFVGAVYDHAQLARLYAKADFAVSPGASGLNVIQALSFGVPVVAAEGDPQSGPEIEAVVLGRTGLLYPAGDLAELTDVLRALARDGQDGYSALSAGALALVRDRYTAEAQAAAVARAVRQIVR